jgi:hypothetical protein
MTSQKVPPYSFQGRLQLAAAELLLAEKGVLKPDEVALIVSQRALTLCLF